MGISIYSIRLLCETYKVMPIIVNYLTESSYMITVKGNMSENTRTIPRLQKTEN